MHTDSHIYHQSVIAGVLKYLITLNVNKLDGMLFGKIKDIMELLHKPACHLSEAANSLGVLDSN